ncbi:MAG: hypothetical protein M1825_006139 [Sarcosagium campestre]|nr:MAG: hypothetical protein M1825_006139 [Sarcosagium campestre]
MTSKGATVELTEPNAWQSPGPAAYDFRSDVVTTPTAEMLAAITRTTLLDDVFEEDTTTSSLEAYVAKLTGHEAGLLVLSGTMGNQVALRTLLTAPPHGVLADSRSHILEWEAGGVASLSGALVKPIQPQNGAHLTLKEVQANAVISTDVHACPTRVISLENTLGGSIMPLDELRAIATFAREHDIRLHLDGARLWEAVVAGAGSLHDYATEFDSVSLCFSKGLGAPIGSILVGSKSFIARARWIRKSIGGGLRQAGIISAAARTAVEETFLGGRLERSHRVAKRLASAWQSAGGSLSRGCETNMVWLDLESVGVDEDRFVESARKYGLKVAGERLVIHYQISDDAVESMEACMRNIFTECRGDSIQALPRKFGSKTYGT